MRTNGIFARRRAGVLIAPLLSSVLLLSGCLSSSGDGSSDEMPPPALPGEVGGVLLDVQNPQTLQYDSFNDQLVVGAVGDWGESDEVAGGVQVISWDGPDFETAVLFRDHDDNMKHGATSAIQVVAKDRAYLVGYHGWGDNALYAFDPRDGAFDEENNEPRVIAGISGKDITDIALSPEGNLWVAIADGEDPRIEIVDPIDDVNVTETIRGFELNPNHIAFTSEHAVVSTVAPDFSSGAHTLVDLGTFNIQQKNLDPDGSDLAVRASGSDGRFFRLERSNMEAVAAYGVDAPGSAILRKDLPSDAETNNPNPQDLVFVGAERNYLLFMNEDRHWRVDASADTPSHFLLDSGALDLERYRVAGEPAKAHAGVQVDDMLFISLQRWYWDDEHSISYADSYVAVFDVSEGGGEVELDTGLASSGSDE